MADVEFFWDPVCPWAWITSCWVRNVQAERPMEVDWRFISLRIINEHRDYDREFPEGYIATHTRGLKLLRVAASVRATEGRAPIGGLYEAFGTVIHPGRNATSLDSVDGIAAALAGLGLDTAHAAAADDTDFDEVIRADTSEAMERCGGNVGTPILSWQPPDGPSFFGPVISKAPRGAEAVKLWDAITELGANPWFSELKRSTRSRPQFD